jgi:methionyl-tRNA formyltransferase
MGVSCHVVEPRFDSGALLDQQLFALSPDETLATLEWKCQLALEQLGRRVIADFASLWQQARPQGPGSYWPRWSDAERTLNLRGPLDAILRQLRAFGDINCLAEANGVGFVVHRAHGWLEPQPHARHPAAQRGPVHAVCRAGWLSGDQRMERAASRCHQRQKAVLSAVIRLRIPRKTAR